MLYVYSIKIVSDVGVSSLYQRMRQGQVSQDVLTLTAEAWVRRPETPTEDTLFPVVLAKHIGMNVDGLEFGKSVFAGGADSSVKLVPGMVLVRPIGGRPTEYILGNDRAVYGYPRVQVHTIVKDSGVDMTKGLLRMERISDVLSQSWTLTIPVAL